VDEGKCSEGFHSLKKCAVFQLTSLPYRLVLAYSSQVSTGSQAVFDEQKSACMSGTQGEIQNKCGQTDLTSSSDQCASLQTCIYHKTIEPRVDKLTQTAASATGGGSASSKMNICQHLRQKVSYGKFG
jgi:hypothetical protein